MVFFSVILVESKKLLSIPVHWCFGIDIVRSLKYGLKQRKNKLIFYSPNESTEPNFASKICNEFDGSKDACYLANILNVFGTLAESEAFVGRRRELLPCDYCEDSDAEEDIFDVERLQQEIGNAIPVLAIKAEVDENVGDSFDSTAGLDHSDVELVPVANLSIEGENRESEIAPATVQVNADLVNEPNETVLILGDSKNTNNIDSGIAAAENDNLKVVVNDRPTQANGCLVSEANDGGTSATASKPADDSLNQNLVDSGNDDRGKEDPGQAESGDDEMGLFKYLGDSEESANDTNLGADDNNNNDDPDSSVEVIFETKDEPFPLPLGMKKDDDLSAGIPFLLLVSFTIFVSVDFNNCFLSCLITV